MSLRGGTSGTRGSGRCSSPRAVLTAASAAQRTPLQSCTLLGSLSSARGRLTAPQTFASLPTRPDLETTLPEFSIGQGLALQKATSPTRLPLGSQHRTSSVDIHSILLLVTKLVTDARDGLTVGEPHHLPATLRPAQCSAPQRCSNAFVEVTQTSLHLRQLT